VTGTPFEQGRFEDLPERPRLPHRYADAQSTMAAALATFVGELQDALGIAGCETAATRSVAISACGPRSTTPRASRAWP